MEMKRYGIQLLGIAEARWKDSGQMRSGETILYSGHMGENAVHSEGVAVMISQDALKTLIGWQPVSPRIMTAKFQTTNKTYHSTSFNAMLQPMMQMMKQKRNSTSFLKKQLEN